MQKSLKITKKQLQITKIKGEINMDKEFEKNNIFGLGNENTAFAQYFIGKSYLNPLTKVGETLFLQM